jgi:hypothetical protein
LVLAVAPAAVAAPIRRVYVGETSQDDRIAFKTARYADGRVLLTRFKVAMTLTCEDATTMSWVMGIHFGSSGPVLADGVTVAVDEADQSQALHVLGEIRRRTGAGTLRFTVPALTDAEQAQLCTTGDVAWDVQRVRR